MTRINVGESSYNKYYEKYDDSSSDDETDLPLCILCQKESISLNRLSHCIHCEIAQDENLLPRFDELPLNEIKNVICLNGLLYWFHQNKWNKIN